MLKALSNLLYAIVYYGILIGAVITAVLAPFGVFFALKTGCIPETLPHLTGWTASDCIADEYYPSLYYMWGLLVRLVFSVPALLVAVLGLMALRHKVTGPHVNPNPSVEEILASLRKVISKDKPL